MISLYAVLETFRLGFADIFQTRGFSKRAASNCITLPVECRLDFRYGLRHPCFGKLADKGNTVCSGCFLIQDRYSEETSSSFIRFVWPYMQHRWFLLLATWRPIAVCSCVHLTRIQVSFPQSLPSACRALNPAYSVHRDRSRCRH